MSAHIGRAYLNTCLKVPIDPCNNCPAPVYSRPKIYFGRSSVSPNTSITAANKKHCNQSKVEQKLSCGSIRSLAKLYDSIPDYRELTHLSGEEFYSTLDTLRSTCQELKVKPNSEDRCSTTTTSTLLTSSTSQLGASRSKKCKKSKKKKKKSSDIENNRKCFEVRQDDLVQNFLNTNRRKISSENVGIEERNKSLPRSSKNDLNDEVESFKKSLQEFEAEFKRSLSSVNRNESRVFTKCSSKESNRTARKDNQKTGEKVPVRTTFTSQLRERLRKSLSFNDLHSLTDYPPELIELRKRYQTLEHLSFKGDSSASQDPTKLSNYFHEKQKSENTGIPKIIVDSPSTDKSNYPLAGKNKSKKNLNKNGVYNMAFKLFDLDSDKKEESSAKYSTPSPVHPVARPNLAATLRVKSSKKKVKELKNNCTFHDTTPQFDWEVRKTPAWKTLSLNETHKEILKLRLATRKAEQALQQREYELNMELMRQRVKSAPLLLEGPTYWGPHVGKLTHACQIEGRRHMCQSNQQRTKRKKNLSRSHSCRRNLFLSSPSILEGQNTFEVQTQTKSRASTSQKFNTLRKIYGCSVNGTKSQSCNSDCSTKTQQCLQNLRRKSKNPDKSEKSCGDDANLERVELDSGDELSSLDRAFL